MGTLKLPLGMTHRNLWFLVRTWPVAYRLAHRHFDQVAQIARTNNMPGLLAKALYSLGVLSHKKKKDDVARSYLEEALLVAQTSGLFIEGKIGVALNSLEKCKR